jgi:hypothetical protein
VAHGASTTADCPLEGCGGLIEGGWSEHLREDGTVCPFGPDHPDWEEWDEARNVCVHCGEADVPGEDLEFDNDQGFYWHRGCRDDCDLCGLPLRDGDGWETYDEEGMHAHTACFEAEGVELSAGP